MELLFEKPLEEIRAEIVALEEKRKNGDTVAASDVAALRRRLKSEAGKIYASLTPWETVQVARHPGRPTFMDYARMCDEFIELHGDRAFGDDRAIIGGMARLGKVRFVLIGHCKGRTTEENIESNFGMGAPEGYRKALRLMKLAEKYQLPVVTLVDTPGAFPGKEAEERGQAEAIARNLTEMARLKVPVVVIVTGEGGSGGALGIAVGDRVLMLENAVYSVISPEGCASILWRDGAKAPEAAKALKITSRDLAALKVIDDIVQEPVGGAHSDPKETMENVKEAILEQISSLRKLKLEKLLERRYAKYAAMGTL
ncbi:MAG: acetyl-CoA carboxylase carboxyltransferase subunit alpha [Kiritimatiellaeota bacterium]|nr:acetyl-CoA carboxylase carboxyltransferase subunit alpha [Kiritimatiellota bacterium]